MADEWKGASYKKVEDHTEATAALLDRVNATTIPVLLRGANLTLDDYLGELSALEKSARLGGDILSTQRLAVELIRICRVQGAIDKMLELLDSLMKRRAQTKQVQSAMVAEASLALSAADGPSRDESSRYALLSKLANVTESKIHVELEHARFVIQLADLVEAEGRKREAADMLQQLQVETITNMPRLEKLACLNRQIALCMYGLQDFLRIPLISRKINHRALNRPDTVETKLKYFELLRDYYEHSEQHLLMARCWYEIFLTLQDEDKKLEALSSMVTLIFISEPLTAKEIEESAECTAFSPQTTLADRDAALKAVLDIKRLENELPSLYQIAKAFTSAELIRVKIHDDVEQLCQGNPVLAEKESRQTQLRNRTSEHDLLVVAKYYTRVKLQRLSRLVGLSVEHVEQFIMTLVSSKSIYAKIDRVEGVVVFHKAKQCSDVVKQWNDDVQKCVQLIDRAAHLVVKERMLHNSLAAAAAAAA